MDDSANHEPVKTAYEVLRAFDFERVQDAGLPARVQLTIARPGGNAYIVEYSGLAKLCTNAVLFPESRYGSFQSNKRSKFETVGAFSTYLIANPPGSLRFILEAQPDNHEALQRFIDETIQQVYDAGHTCVNPRNIENILEVYLGIAPIPVVVVTSDGQVDVVNTIVQDKKVLTKRDVKRLQGFSFATTS